MPRIEVQFERNSTYPLLLPKAVTVENLSKKDKKILIKKTSLSSNRHNLKSILLDTGATDTIIPNYFVKRLKISLNPNLHIVQGATGMGFFRRVADPIKIELREGNNRINNTVVPIVITRVIPRIESDFQFPEDSAVISELDYKELKLIFKKENYYEAFVSTRPTCSLLNRRLHLVNIEEISQFMETSQLMLGRDWQEPFDITFRERSVYIKTRLVR